MAPLSHPSTKYGAPSHKNSRIAGSTTTTLMDPRTSYLHHHTRYTHPPQPPLPPQPHPLPFPTNNFHYQCNLLPHPPQQFRPPPPLPPPSHQPILPPPPPSFDRAQNSQFTYNPNHEFSPYNYHHIHDNYIPNVDQLPRVFHPTRSFDNDRPRRVPEFREAKSSFRDLPANWHDPELPYRGPLELEANSRFVGNEHNQRDAHLLSGRGGDNSHRSLGSVGQCRSNNVRSCREFRSFESHLENYENHHRRRELPHNGHNDGMMNESHKWAPDREVKRQREVSSGSRDSLMDIGGDDEIVVTGKRIAELYRNREGNGGEFERHGSKVGGSREGIFELNRTSRKQMQKKSAFIRTQKPIHYRNRDDKRGHSIGYLDDSKSFRGNISNKNNDTYFEHGKIGEGSPVELDVSFKSNSLVAKAIVTPTSSLPSSTAVGVSDTNSTPTNSKIRKVLVLNRDRFNSWTNKPNDDSIKLDNFVNITGNASSSDYDQGHSKERISDPGNVCDCNSLPSFNGANILMEKGMLESPSMGTLLDKGGTNTVSDTRSSSRIVKKRKIVKKSVKKIVNRSQNSSNSQSSKLSDEHMKANGVAHALPAASDPESKVANRNDIDNAQTCLNEVTVLPENDKEFGSEKAMKPQEAAVTGSHTDRICLPSINKKRSHSSSPLGSSSNKGTEVCESLIYGTSVNSLLSMSEMGKDYAKSVDGTIISGARHFEDISKKFLQKGDSFLLENNAATRSSEAFLSLEGNTDIVSLTSEKFANQEGPLNSFSASLGNKGLIQSQEGITAPDVSMLNLGCKQPCSNQSSPPPEEGIADQLPKSTFTGVSNESLCLSNLGETKILNITMHADSSNHGLRNILLFDNGRANSEIKFSSHGIGDNVCENPSPDGVATSPEKFSLEGSLGSMFSLSGTAEDTPNVKKIDNNVETSLLDLSSLVVTDMHLESSNMIRSAHLVDTTLRLSFKDPNPVDVCDDIGHQISTNGIGVLQQNSLRDISEVRVSVSSCLSNNKREFSASQLELYSPIARDISERPIIAVTSTSGMEVPSNSGYVLERPAEEVMVSGLDPTYTSVLLPLQKAATGFSGNCSGGEFFDAAASGKNAYQDNGLKVADSHSNVETLAVPKAAQSLCLSELGVEQFVNAAPVMGGSSHLNGAPLEFESELSVCAMPVMVASTRQNDDVDMETGEGSKMDVDTIKQVIVDRGTAQPLNPSELQHLDIDVRSSTDVMNDRSHVLENILPSMRSNLSSFEDRKTISTANNSEESMEFGLDKPHDVGSPETFLHDLGTSPNEIPIEKVSGDNTRDSFDKPASQGSSMSSACASHSQNAEVILNPDPTGKGDHPFSEKAGTLPSQNSRNSNALNATGGGVHGRKSQSSHAVSRIYPGCSSFIFTASKSTASSTHITKPRTWRRTDNSSASSLSGSKALSGAVFTQRQCLKTVTKSQGTSYIRKGNSLVRKPAPAATQSLGSYGLSSPVYHFNPSGTNELKKGIGPDCRVDVIDPPDSVRSGGANTSFERPRTPPIPRVPKVLNRAELLHDGSAEIVSDSMRFSQSADVLKSSENVSKISETPMIQTGQINNMECNSGLSDENVVSSNTKITYVKRKSNQLVATSNPHGSSLPNLLNALTSDGYYKRRKNQLVRTSMESQAKQHVSMPDESASSDGQTALNNISGRNLSKRQLRKVVTKTCKTSKSSLVWTLRGTQFSNNNGDALHRQKVLPHLFPWKRVTYWRSFLSNSAANSNHNSSSTFRKLLFSRNRDTIYTRSKHGFSLRMSKVLSVGGSSLKWSKSIERRSKKANEEATLAVAAAERKKREQRVSARVMSGTKSRNSSRERIFRIGSVRYKMDSSRRTLHRISDDESSCPSVLQAAKDGKKCYVPRRLVIGKDEYVRVGNGTQLIRDPKKRIRILASEKVRWSLHTARSRLARKRKYCQFFTRFGKCNKDDGKCLYIHDSSKIAVCTKFLNGLCSNPDCKLTHQVIPERMPDCSYFLQGLCANKNCPYRHVHVNPNASTCEGFLRGYCAEANECRKKHSYVCPIFEAAGSCPQGSKCKLHHPKNRRNERKGKQLQEKKNSRGRYFGSMDNDSSKLRRSVSEEYSVLDNETFFEGSIADYVSLDVIDEAAQENNIPIEQTTVSDSDALDLLIGDDDELIKPIRIMNI